MSKFLTRSLIAALAVVVLGSACGGGSGGEAGQTTIDLPSSTTTSGGAVASSTTTAVASTTLTSATTTTAASTSCAPVEGTEALELGDRYAMDVDGDLVDDSVVTYIDRLDEGGHLKGLIVEYAAGGSSLHSFGFGSIDVHDASTSVSYELQWIPIGMFDTNDDGGLEMFVIEFIKEFGILGEDPTGSGYTMLNVLGTSDCELFTIWGRSSPLSFELALYPSIGAKVECADGAIRTFRFYGTPPAPVGVQVEVYRVAGRDASQESDDQIGRLALEELEAMPMLNCGGLQLP